VRKSLQPAGGETAERGLSHAPESSLQPIAAGAAISLYAGWNARHLLGAWVHSPYDRCDSVAFVLWLFPIGLYWALRRSQEQPRPLGMIPFAIALAVSFAGVAMDLSFLEYLAFAVALAGFIPFRPASVLWLPCAALWMPGAGWAFSSHGPLPVNAARVGVALCSLLLIPFLTRDEPLR